MRFHWGHGIFTFIGIFVLAMAFLVYKSLQYDFPLVEKEYYPKGLDYQTQINKKRNADSLPEKIKIQQQPDFMEVIYPPSFRQKDLSGNLYFYCPSGDQADYNVAIKPDSAMKQQISKTHLSGGKYILKIDWTLDNKAFYQEETFFKTTLK